MIDGTTMTIPWPIRIELLAGLRRFRGVTRRSGARWPLTADRFTRSEIAGIGGDPQRPLALFTGWTSVCIRRSHGRHPTDRGSGTGHFAFPHPSRAQSQFVGNPDPGEGSSPFPARLPTSPCTPQSTTDVPPISPPPRSTPKSHQTTTNIRIVDPDHTTTPITRPSRVDPIRHRHPRHVPIRIICERRRPIIPVRHTHPPARQIIPTVHNLTIGISHSRNPSRHIIRIRNRPPPTSHRQWLPQRVKHPSRRRRPCRLDHTTQRIKRVRQRRRRIRKAHRRNKPIASESTGRNHPIRLCHDPFRRHRR